MNPILHNKLNHLPNLDSLLKISLGLILFTIISTALVYAETISVDVEGNSYVVDYDATGLTVSDIEADLDFISLILTVDVTDSLGILEITFDRNFFDSIYEGSDDEFIILADGDEPNFTEIETNSQSRTLNIELPSGTEDVEIIGSIFGSSVEEKPEPVEEKPEPVEEKPEPVEEKPEPVEEKPEPVEEKPEPVEEKPEPVEEKPEPVEEKPKTECGPGTILEDGFCVLDERCGPGTILEDGVCVLDSSSSYSSPSSNDTSLKGLGKEFLIGIVAAFVIAGTIGIIIALMSKAGKRKN